MLLVTNKFALYTVIFLHYDGKFLLLQRALTKKIAPGGWTGVGGKVEAGEFDDLQASALRELKEETGLGLEQINRFVLRRALFHNRSNEPLTGLIYYTAEYEGEVPDCPEGELHWKYSSDFDSLDLIKTTARTLPYLVDDIRRDPDGLNPLKIGVTHYQEDGDLSLISWSSPPLER